MTFIRRVCERKRERDLPAYTAMKGMLHHVGIVTTPTIIVLLLQYCCSTEILHTIFHAHKIIEVCTCRKCFQVETELSFAYTIKVATKLVATIRFKYFISLLITIILNSNSSLHHYK